MKGIGILYFAGSYLSIASLSLIIPGILELGTISYSLCWNWRSQFARADRRSKKQYGFLNVSLGSMVWYQLWRKWFGLLASWEKLIWIYVGSCKRLVRYSNGYKLSIYITSSSWTSKAPQYSYSLHLKSSGFVIWYLCSIFFQKAIMQISRELLIRTKMNLVASHVRVHTFEDECLVQVLITFFLWLLRYGDVKFCTYIICRATHWLKIIFMA